MVTGKGKKDRDRGKRSSPPRRGDGGRRKDRELGRGPWKKEERRVRTTRPREVVLPGDVLSKRDLRGGEGTYMEDGIVYSSSLGVKTVHKDRVAVIPLSGRYIPTAGDDVIGKVIDFLASTWLVDINSPYLAPLHSDEVPWEVGPGEAGRYLTMGDDILIRITEVDALNKVKITMVGRGLEKLANGYIITISHSKVPRLIGKGGSMIRLLKDRTDCRIQVGQNGRVWLEGEPDMVLVATEAISMIDRNAHHMGLTERVDRFLAERLGKDAKGVADGKDGG